MYIVYKRTSPSGHSYIGYTKDSLMGRWQTSVKELKDKSTPLAHAIRKYGADQWKHEVLFETDDVELAHKMEIELIAQFGYYNLAKGGSGGNTGRNGEPAKIAKQAKSLSEHWKCLPEEEKQRRISASIASRIENGTLGNNSPRYGEDHGNWSGFWVVHNIPYLTLIDATTSTGLNESTIIDLCIRSVDKVYVRGSKLVEKGKTPRQCGHYKKVK